eukprot:11205264-Lingulodinium_polyedra.AAC.1
MMPLTEAGPETRRQRLVQAAPGWSEIPLRRAAKYLGFMLGPGRGDSSFHAPLWKFKHRLEAWRRTDGG